MLIPNPIILNSFTSINGGKNLSLQIKTYNELLYPSNYISLIMIKLIFCNSLN